MLRLGTMQSQRELCGEGAQPLKENPKFFFNGTKSSSSAVSYPAGSKVCSNPHCPASTLKLQNSLEMSLIFAGPPLGSAGQITES